MEAAFGGADALLTDRFNEEKKESEYVEAYPEDNNQGNMLGEDFQNAFS